MSVLDTVKENRRRLKADLAAIAAKGTRVTPTEEAEFHRGIELVGEMDARIDQLQEEQLAEARVAKSHAEINGGRSTSSGWSVTGEPEVYTDPLEDRRPGQPSFFRDLRNSRLGDWAAAERLQRNHARAMERRAGDMTTTAGQGGEMAPPAWLVAEFVALARPGRVTANLCHRNPLPSGVSSINLPKISGGTSTAVQATQNSALSDTAMTTTSVSSGVTTIGGKQIVSLQLLSQSGIPFDRVVLQDLAADYAKQIDKQVLYGSNASGQLRGLVGVSTNTAFTTASPAFVSSTAANSFYNKVIAASAGIATTRYLPAQAIVMHPNRWAWCLEALDSNTRPIIAADGGIFNAPAISTDVVAEGSTGTIGKLPVYLDPNISLTANSATNQDEVYVLRTDDLELWESELMMESFDATYADQASVLFRALAYSAFIPDRYTASIGSIRGTGLIAPTL